ncbi:condensin complex component SMC1 [Dissoconium aciculare CBS 342.82]|uniref:Structural maintenance of chromosomes protein n=1 Tax=Dissoconium aciculare CBS 342.82 TaxID=1314786 RepID=A0A6J3MJ63_9PEZI|nr:condensin complex component SMC1 [Dissoconium aciculare CBS 342.82]KAF1827920.1 condensin complex component SMC1 [Dissoconium aciculare CBS 342.82]
MGKLLALELFNFKSYKGHHVLQFGDSYFTSIIGPNGSGKSNSMDAISFVLGIKSSHLRSTHLKDLVYRGRVLKTSKVDADGQAIEGGPDDGVNGDSQAAAASDDEDASTQTSGLRNDPTTAWVMAVYEDDAGEEQRWKRSITSNGGSEYRINNRSVTAKTYNEALEAENILIKARNFLVFQGDVEAIAAQSPKDLTRLIEQISGSFEYKAEYERLKAEKDKADEEQTYKLQQRRGINGEIKQYQQQKEELDKFEQTRDEKDQAVVNQILWKLWHFQRTIQDSTAEIQKHQAELKEFNRTVQKHRDQLDKAKAEQAKVDRDIKKHERDVKQREKAVEDKENALVPIDEKLSIHTSNVKKYESLLQEIGGERDTHKKDAAKLKSDLDTVQKAQKRWEKEWRNQQQQAGRELSDEDLQELERLRADVYKRTGGDQTKLDNITRQIKTDEETVTSLESKVQSTESAVTSLTEEISGLETRKKEVQKVVGATTKEIETKRVAINSLTSDRDRTEQVKRELDEKLHQVLVRLNEAVGYQRETHKEAQHREMVSQMKRLYSGVKGTLGHLCHPKQKKYETAVATVLGRHYDAIVVDSEKTAKDCIQYLKEQRAGQATFIPLDTIIHKQANANLRGMHQGMRLAIDTIDFDTSLERAMSYACGNSIVCDNISIARNLCYQKGIDAKAVTLDGTIIHKGGNMTGGDLHDKKRRFEDSEVENLRTLADKIKGDLDTLPKGHKRQAEEEQLRSEISGLETKQRYAQDELNALNNNISSKKRTLQHMKSQLAEIKPKYEEQSSRLASLKETLVEHSSSVAQIEDQVFGAFCQRLGYANIREYEKQQGALQQEAQQKKAEFTRQTSRLSNQLILAEQQLQQIDRRIQANQASMKRERDTTARLKAEREEIAGELDVLNAEIEAANGEIEGLKAEFDARGERVNEARREVQKREKSVEKTLKEVSTLETEVQQAATGRFGLLRTCKVEGINLPLERGSRKIDSLPLEDAVLEVDEDEDAMDVDDRDGTLSKISDYGIHVDFTTLDDDLREDATDEIDAQLSEAISTLQLSLDKMAPNMRSAERLEATSERLKATEKEFNDSRSAARRATRDFEHIRQQRMDLFNTAFSHIAEQIGQVYRELTKTPSFPLGGAASLDVEDEDEPYLSGVRYHAMPPLKRFRDMEHLSGGEKTMAALALLFAVHTFAPSPFFVLDEVDAALDHANTTQLAQYVRAHAGPGMQFVVISLKTGLFQNSETLVGVMRDQAVNSSRALTLDLRKYQAV